MKKIKLAIVGATGVVGRKFLEVLAERNIQVETLVLFASARSEGITIDYLGKPYPVKAISKDAILANPVDFVLFSAGSDIALTYAPIFASQKTVVIDNSSAWRMHPDVPLVVPEVNKDAIHKDHYIIANPNCSTIQAVVALKPLHDAFTLQRMVISTYQAVSGAGSKGIHDYQHALPTGKTTKFPYQIVGNVIPQIDVFMPNGNTKEEEKIISETRKIMNLPTLPISSTAVRVPVLNAHSESINLTFAKPFTIEAVRNLLKQAPGLVLLDDVAHMQYPMPLMVDGHDEVYVGRVRRDESVPNGLNLFVVGDNLRKGAATNAVQILQWLLTRG
jgi:aspartate-semialdehyde dehydrogenase